MKGINMVGWIVTCNEGKLMSKLTKRTLHTITKVTDLKTISQEVEFDEKVNYPYSFTVICGSRRAGREGEGEFELKVYARDPKFKIEKLNHFDQQ